MKFKAWVKDAAKQSNLLLNIPKNNYSGNGSHSMIELEASDFDVAINLLDENNKRAKVKEYRVFKQEFVEGNADPYDIEPKAFVNQLKGAVVGRADRYTTKRVEKSVDQAFSNFSELREIESGINSLIHCFARVNGKKASLEETTNALAQVEKELVPVVKFLEESKGNIFDKENLANVLEQVKVERETRDSDSMGYISR